MPPIKTSSSNLTLTYDALDILGDNDKSLFLHKRPLLNAETMVKKGHFKSALEIYYRAVSKISNSEIQKKIQKNISDIHAYLKNSDPDSEKVFLEKYSDNREKEFNESLKELTENLSDSLAEKLNILKQIETVPEREPKKLKKEDESEIKPLDLGALDTKPKKEPKPEVEEEPEEIEGNLTFEKDGTEEKDSKELPDKQNLPQSSKEKKPKKANIKVKQDIEPEKQSSDIQAQTAQIKNESAEFTGDTTIQSSKLESDSIQIGNQNISTSDQSNPNTFPNNSTESEKIEFPSESDAKPSTAETKIVEEIRITKEYKEQIDSPPPISESISDSSKSKKNQSTSTSSISTRPSSGEQEELLFPHTPEKADIETGWSELESEAPKPKGDKDYAPLMKKYEAGNIEIPEATEFITGEFVSIETKDFEETKNRGNNEGESSQTKRGKDSQSGFSGSVAPGMLQGLPSNESFENDNNYSSNKKFDDDLQAFNPPALPPPLPLNINDWLSNLFFSKEWEKFKPLPMKERRSGKDRRVSTANELPKSVKKNRRSGHDRRRQNADLIQEREEFLKDWHKENQNHSPSLSQILGNVPQSNQPNLESGNLFSPDIDPNLKTLEFLPRDPSSTERSPSGEDLIKVELPDPEEIILKPPIDQNEVKKEDVTNNIADTLSKYVPANEELGLPESDKGLVKIDLPDPVLLKSESAELPHREVSGEIEVSSKDGTGIGGDVGKSQAANKESAKDTSGMGPVPYTPEAYSIPEELKIELPDPDDFVRTKSGHLIDPFAPEETPEINMIEGDGPLPSEEEGAQISEIPELPPPPPEPERTIHGILELKPPEIDDAPFLTLTYDFSKIPHPFKLSKNYSIMEYSYYKYKPMLMKAQEFARRKMLKNALNYYRVIKSQNIPPELKNMINRNITDITEFLEKFIMSKGG